MKKLIFILALTSLFLKPEKNHAQRNNKDWSVEIGLNIVDVRIYQASAGDILKDYFGATEWPGNTGFPRIAIQKYLGNKLSLQLVGTINSLNTIVSLDDSNAKYLSIDAILKRDLTKLFASKSWFDPYLLLGLGSQTIASDSDIVVIGGLGFNILFDKRYGVNLQTSYKHGFGTGDRDVFQHSISFVYKFSMNSFSKGKKRRWD